MALKTKQQLFNESYLGMQAQNWEPAIDALGGCAYLAASGKKCAVGQCIPDDKYNPEFERIGSLETKIMMAELQLVHDGHSGSGETLKQKFENFAKDWNLTVPVVE